MTFFPTGMQPGVQVLWQPVAIQQIQNETIEQLRRQNNMLKLQLQAVLKHVPQMNNNFGCCFAETDRFSQGAANKFNMAKRISENACYSSRMSPNHQRIYSNHSPRLRDVLSPRQGFPSNFPQQPLTLNDQGIKRMAISKGKDGKYYRDKMLQNQNSQASCNNDNTRLNRVNTAETGLNTPAKTPLKRSHFPNLQSFVNHTDFKPVAIRIQSPSFLRERHKEHKQNIKQSVAVVKHVRLNEAANCFFNDSCFKRTPPTQQQYELANQQSENKHFSQPPEKKNRKSIKIPTIELSAECDSELSIDRAVREFRKGKKKTKCDTFLYQIQQELEGMYGGKDEEI